MVRNYTAIRISKGIGKKCNYSYNHNYGNSWLHFSQTSVNCPESLRINGSRQSFIIYILYIKTLNILRRFAVSGVAQCFLLELFKVLRTK